MIDLFVKQWHQNKELLEKYYSNLNLHDFKNLEYIDLVKNIFLYVIKEPKFDIQNITVINDSNHQGTEIYILPKCTYSPEIYEYFFTYNYYGSCSGCDDLERILSSINKSNNINDAIKDILTLSLHLIQRIKYLITKEKYDKLLEIEND